MKGIWPFRHLGLKLWSVVIAVLLWLVVAGEQTVERGLRVPLELQQFPTGLELQSEPPALIDVRVRGSSAALGRIAGGDIVAVLDLHSARPGRRLFQLSSDQVRAPFGVQVVQVTPSNLTLTFENTATRRLPVSASIEGNPAPGFIVGKVAVEPAMVDVVGPETIVARVTEAITEPVSVADARSDVKDTVAVGLLDPALRLATSQNAAVKVQILPGPEERELHGRPVHLRGTTPGLVATAVPPAVDLVLRGAKASLTGVDPEDVVVYVDVAGLGPGQYQLAVHADGPSDAGVARINPATVQVRISSVK